MLIYFFYRMTRIEIQKESGVLQNFKRDYSAFQEGIKRMEAAMCGMSDRVPVFSRMHEFALQELGVIRSCDTLN